MSSELTASTAAFLVVESLTVGGVTLESTTGEWTHGKHVVCIYLAFAFVGSEVTGLV
jgi:hypothetical protein